MSADQTTRQAATPHHCRFTVFHTDDLSCQADRTMHGRERGFTVAKVLGLVGLGALVAAVVFPQSAMDLCTTVWGMLGGAVDQIAALARRAYELATINA